MSVSTVPSEATIDRPDRRRLLLLRVFAVVFALATAVASFGLPSLVLAWGTTGDELELRTAYVVWGVLAGLLVPGLALLLLARPRVGHARALLALVAATVLVVVQAPDLENLEYAAYIAGPTAVLLLLHPMRREVFARLQLDRVAALPVALAAAPALWYAVDLASQSRSTSNVDPMHGQYAQGAVLAVALLLIAAVGALRGSGRRGLALLVAASTTPLGLAGVLFPDDPMSPGVIGGALILVAAAVYVAVVLGRPEHPAQAAL